MEENDIIFTVIQFLLKTILCHKLPNITALTLSMLEWELNLYVHISNRKMKGALHTCWFVGLSSVFTFLKKAHNNSVKLAYQKIFSLVAYTACFYKCTNAHKSQK